MVVFMGKLLRGVDALDQPVGRTRPWGTGCGRGRGHHVGGAQYGGGKEIRVFSGDVARSCHCRGAALGEVAAVAGLAARCGCAVAWLPQAGGPLGPGSGVTTGVPGPFPAGADRIPGRGRRARGTGPGVTTFGPPSFRRWRRHHAGGGGERGGPGGRSVRCCGRTQGVTPPGRPGFRPGGAAGHGDRGRTGRRRTIDAHATTPNRPSGAEGVTGRSGTRPSPRTRSPPSGRPDPRLSMATSAVNTTSASSAATSS